MEKLRRYKDTLNLAFHKDQIYDFTGLSYTILANSCSSILIGVDSNVEQLNANLIAAEQDRQLEKLPRATGAAFNSWCFQHDSECLADTRVNLLHRIKTWGVDQQRPICWLSGIAGTGKSTIARTIASRFQVQRSLGGSFFFSRGEGPSGYAYLFISTLAYYPARTSSHLRTGICTAITDHNDIFKQGLRDQWCKLIIRPLFKAKMTPRPCLNFVVDTLDECNSEDNIKLLLQLFVEVKDIDTVNLGIFLTSRPETAIRLGFGQMPEIIHHDLDLHAIPRSVMEHDINVFFMHELGKIKDTWKLRDWPSEEDLQYLVQRSDGLFIYAATVCRFLKSSDWLPQDRLLQIF